MELTDEQYKEYENIILDALYITQNALDEIYGTVPMIRNSNDTKEDKCQLIDERNQLFVRLADNLTKHLLKQMDR